MTQRRLAPDGTVADWVPVEIVRAENEDWSEYELEDGTEFRAKSIVAQVEKAVDEDGEPILDEEEEPHLRIQFDSAIETDSD